MKLNIALLSIISTSLFISTNAYAWGERGHHITGYAAARLTQQLTTPEEKEKLGVFFHSRAIQMGHLNNIPDISWKTLANKKNHHLNNPTHFFDSEYIVEKPAADSSDAEREFFANLRNLEPDPVKFLKLYDNKPNRFADPNYPTINVFADVGTAPFRVQQMYELLKSALACAAKKMKMSSRPLQNPLSSGSYTCTKNQTREEAIYAATALAGVMGHFVADLTQPMHTSVDYDAHSTGQAGLHAYFETHIVHHQDEALTQDVLTLAQNPDFQKGLQEQKVLSTTELSPTQLMFHLVANSQSHLPKLLELDRQYSLVSESPKMPFGHKTKGRMPDASRRAQDNPQALDKYRPLIVSRLATGSWLLSQLWLRAWRESGSPTLNDANTVAIPYPLDVPFIFPDKIWMTQKLEKTPRKKQKKEKK